MHAIHQFIQFVSPIVTKDFFTTQIWGALPRESYKTALKVASGVALLFFLYCSRRLYRHFSPNSTPPPRVPSTLLQEPTLPPVIPGSSPTAPLEKAEITTTPPASSSAPLTEEDEVEFYTPPSEEIGELAVTEPEQQRLVEKLQQVKAEQQPLSPLEKLTQIFLPFSYVCELPRQSGTQKINLVDYFLQPNNINNCMLDENGRFTLTYNSKQELTIRYLPDFDSKKVPVSLQSLLKTLVDSFSPKVQISDSLCGQIIRHESSLEVTFDKGGIVIPEIARFPSNYKAELKTIKFTRSSKKDEPSTVLFIDAEHNCSTASLLGHTGENLKAYPHLLIKFLDRNLFPHEYGLS